MLSGISEYKLLSTSSVINVVSIGFPMLFTRRKMMIGIIYLVPDVKSLEL